MVRRLHAFEVTMLVRPARGAALVLGATILALATACASPMAPHAANSGIGAGSSGQSTSVSSGIGAGSSGQSAAHSGIGAGSSG